MDRLLDSASGWGLSRRAAAALLVLPFLGLFVLVVARMRVDVYEFILREDGPVEWLQVLAYAACVPAAAVAANHLRRRGDMPIAAAYAFVAFGAFFIAGEEISWGQRVFGVETPEAFAEVNRQGEMGVHNVGGVEGVFRIVMLSAALYGSVIALIARRRFRDGQRVDLLVPPLFLISAFGIAAAHRLGRVLVLHEPGWTYTVLGEWTELCFAAAVLTFLSLNARRLRGDLEPARVRRQPSAGVIAG